MQEEKDSGTSSYTSRNTSDQGSATKVHQHAATVSGVAAIARAMNGIQCSSTAPKLDSNVVPILQKQSSFLPQ